MKIVTGEKQYQTTSFEFSPDEGVSYILITCPTGKNIKIYPFMYQPIKLTYDNEGIEHKENAGTEYLCCRYTGTETGKYSFVVFKNKTEAENGYFILEKSDEHGYVEIDKNDSNYFAYSDGTPFFSIGINLAFPVPYGVSNGDEFGLSGETKYIGMRQYEDWFKKCSQNNINVARIWLGHEYFCPDTENIYEFDYSQFSKIDMLIELAAKYNIKLKLTIEQFRYFDYETIVDASTYGGDVFNKFNKRLYAGDTRCTGTVEWLSGKVWNDGFAAKLSELSKRYSGNTNIFCIELWNEMNCVIPSFCEDENEVEILLDWNKKFLKLTKELFPNQLVTNSIGSMESDFCVKFYNEFCWEYADFIQIHRYLDQGAPLENCKHHPIDVLSAGVNYFNRDDKPMFIAETGAVNNRHTGPFKYYSTDDKGLLLADFVYTPVFLKCAGAGNMWHWDNRYIEFKNLYKMYKPISKLIENINFGKESFVPANLSNDNAYILMLKGKNTSLVYVRNKNHNWENCLRDLNEASPVDEIVIECNNINNIEVVQIWEDESAAAFTYQNKIIIKNCKYGIMLKVFIK